MHALGDSASRCREPHAKRAPVQLMRRSCQAIGMKPVCDHPSYCRNDKKAVYIGQNSHIAYRPYRRINKWFPSGWSSIQTNWDHLCSYCNKASGGGTNALCNIPFNTHAWRRPAQYNPGFMCARVCSGSGCAAAPPAGPTPWHCVPPRAWRVHAFVLSSS